MSTDPDDNEHEYLRIARELGSLPELESIQRVRVHAQNYLIFARNHDELRQRFNAHRGGETGVAELWDVNNRDKLFELQREVSRLLHNFLASASSLIDTTRVLFGRCDQSKFPDYQARVDSEFKSDKLARFVVCLRQYALHYAALPITSQLSIGGGGAESVLQLDRATIDKYSSWDKHAKEFLAEHSGPIGLEMVVDGYYSKVRSFYEWFYRRMEEVLATESAVVNRKLEELRRSHYSLADDFLSTALVLFQRGFGTPDDIFRQAIPPDERIPLQREHDPVKRCESMLATVQSRKSLAPELVQAIRSAFRSYSWQQEAHE